MTPRAKWIAVASAVGVFSIVAYGSRLPPQPQPQQPGDRRESFGSSTGPVSPSVIGSWTSHGADDGPIVMTRSPAIEVAGRGGRITAVAPPGSIPKGLLDGDRVLDILVLWRWPGEAPEIAESGGRDVTPTGPVLHRFVAGGREFRVEHNRQQGTVVVDAAVVPLEGANVLMLDVEETRVRVSGLATVDPRFPRPSDPAQMVMARSPAVKAFVSGGR